MVSSIFFSISIQRLKSSIFFRCLVNVVVILNFVNAGSQSNALAQGLFLDVSDEINIYSDHTDGYWGTGLSLADFNGDGLDDLTLAHHSGDLRFYLGNGAGFEEVELGLSDYPFEAKAPIWADIDNDGDQDLFITYRLAPNKLYRNGGGLNFEDISSLCGINQMSYRSYGASFGDFDNDGLLDLFVANYAYGQDPPLNELYRNLGNGQFEDVTMEFAMGEAVTHSFQGHWVDFNEDGLLDLHLIRDRLDFDNRYYKQLDDGTFIEDAHAMGLDLSINAMCTSTADYDRDFDQDLYMSAGMWEGNFFMINDGGDFSQHEPDIGDNLEVNLTSWGANWLDADNNGWEDLHVCTGFSTYTLYPMVFDLYADVPDQCFWNDMGIFQADTTGLFDENVLSFCAAVGDINLDGFPDIVNHAVGEHAQILTAVPNDNHWIRLQLQGTVSNRDGIGSKIKVYSDELLGYRMTYCGENYLSQNSRWEHFGLGTIALIDSVVVEWPSGTIDVYHDLISNQSLLLTEGETLAETVYGCTYVGACNYDALAEVDDGFCDFSCLMETTICSTGLHWNAATAQCELSCSADFTQDGYVQVDDLLLLLGSFEDGCE